MMPIGYGKGVKAGSNEELLQELKETYEVLPDARQHGYGPAVYYRIPGFLGSIGFISAIHGKFCDHCNRIRLSSQGYLKSCLCYDKGADLRSIVRSGQDLKEVQQSLRGQMAQAIGAKPAAHCFEAPEQITEQQDMFRIGG
jgi:cyclic pyranopterin phosphate synthase